MGKTWKFKPNISVYYGQHTCDIGRYFTDATPQMLPAPYWRKGQSVNAWVPCSPGESGKKLSARLISLGSNKGDLVDEGKCSYKEPQ